MFQFFETSQFLTVDAERAFCFFADPQNLPRISPPESKTRIVRLKVVSPPDHPGLAGEGSEIEMSVRLFPRFPIRRRWLARIVEFEYGAYFRDAQVRGPFAHWDHTHSFQASGAGTIISDIVEYEVGYGKLGEAANAFLIRDALKKMFVYRHRATERLLAQAA
jgi:ligand-binding SRPBCC domain-containing protein